MHRISVSHHAVLTMPTHIILDSISEKSKGDKKIGSTGRGITPSYADLINRTALRVGDIFHIDFKERYEKLREDHKKILLNNYGYSPDNEEFAKLEKNFFEGIEFLRSLKIIESAHIVDTVLEHDGKIIAEGAQGSLLDIRFGHYPYVTSSHTISSGVGVGLGLPPEYIGGAIGVFKAYVTKVGEGPFPTELGGEESSVWCRDKKIADEKLRFPNPDPNSNTPFEQGAALRRLGNEIGATTGRLRRTGWLDLPLLKYAIKINNATELVLTKLDVLSGFKELKVCTAYIIDGKETINLPFDLSRTKVGPIYKSFPVWKGKLTDYENGKSLPKEAIDYIKFLENNLEVPIIYAGTGPEEHHVVERYW